MIDADDIVRTAGKCWFLNGRYVRLRDGTFLHRVILDSAAEVDHINGNRLDCRKSNLRPATHAENGKNRARSCNNTSGYKGVSWRSDLGRWQARIMADGHTYSLGTFENAIKAALAYDAAALTLHGQFARLNLDPAGRGA